MAPEQLLTYLQQPHDAHHLTFAAEAAGEIKDEAFWPEAKRVLLSLLGHSSPLVREGAVYGLSSYLDDEVVDHLENTRMHDASPGVRDAAIEVLYA